MVNLIVTLLGYYKIVLIATIVLNWLLALGLVNRFNRFVSTTYNFCLMMTEPVLEKVRDILPFIVISGIDFSPMVVFFLINFVIRMLYSI